MDFSNLKIQFKPILSPTPEIGKNYFFVENSSFEFHLKRYSTDISLLKNPKVTDQNDILFYKILQVACNGKGLEELSSKFYALGSETVNRLDRYQNAAPLHYASINGYTPVVQFLIDNGADLDIWDGSRKVTPLICAAARGHLEIVQLLIENGCDVNAGLNATEQSGTALLWAVKRNQPEIIKCLLAKNSCQSSTVLYSETPIHAAVMVGSVAILEMLICHKDAPKLDVHMGIRRDTPLHLAVRGEYPNFLETCKLLLQKGNVSVGAVNATGKTGLHLAAAQNNAEIIKMLLSHLALVDAQDKDGRTALFHTIGDDKESLKSMKVLIVTGKCNVNHQDNYGYTTLHLAGFRGSERAAEVLLMGGADFSLKTTGGVSALSMLHRKIPHTTTLLQKVFDQAVTISQEGNSNDLQGSSPSAAEVGRPDCKIDVNFKYVLPSPQSSNHVHGSNDLEKNDKRSRLSRMATVLSIQVIDEDEDSGILRKETAKIKCLAETGMSSLLLHPVVHSFLDMKWQKARPILLPVVLYRLAFVLLFSLYVGLPYWMYDETTSKSIKGKLSVSTWFFVMYCLLLILAVLKGVVEVIHFLRAPKTHWRSLEHWMSLTVLLILIFNMRPDLWGTEAETPIHRSMAALGILLAWIDIWINMSRFPKLGESIRVFFQVFQNFASFILPHFCLLAGFVLSLTLLMPGNGEFDMVPLTTAKIVRIMAGDITISSNGSGVLDANASLDTVASHFLLVYIYTAFVLMVAIVLMNLLIGLAVNDIQGIYAEASMKKLIKQTLLLNTMESSFKGRLIQRILTKRFEANYINLFKTESEKKILVFMPYDSNDLKVSTELKLALLNIGNANLKTAPAYISNTASESTTTTPSGEDTLSSQNAPIWRSERPRLMRSEGEAHRILMERISLLVSEFLMERNRLTTVDE